MSLRPLPQSPCEVSHSAVNAAAVRRTREREANRVGLAQLVCALLVGALLAATAVGSPLWTHKPASDIKWYRVTDVGKVKEAYKVKLEFKNNLGAAGTAAKVAKFGFGGLGAIGKGGGDDRDEPVALYRRENGTVVVAGKQHLLAFDPRARQIVWSVKYDAPGVPGWQKLAMAGLTALAYTSATASAANSYYGTAENRWANKQRVSSLVAYEQFVSRRYSATKQTGNYVYVLTTVKDGKEKGAGLVGVHMETGRGDRQILFKDKEPDYQVDELAGRVFNLRNSRELSAFAVDPAPPAEEKKN